MPDIPQIKPLKFEATQGEKTSGCYLTELNDNGSIKETIRFQWFPETLSDTKAVNYQQKEVPGGSLPLYQWINSGERLISFTAIFTADNNLLDEEGGKDTEKAAKLQDEGHKRYNQDLRAAIWWLRRFMLPTYQKGRSDVGTPLTFAPKKLLLIIPGSGIGLAGGGAQLASADAVRCVMNQCDVTYEELFANGFPRIVTVQLTFVEIPQFGGGVQFPSATVEKLDELIIPYGLKDKA